jgi:hypothetical protein
MTRSGSSDFSDYPEVLPVAIFTKVSVIVRHIAAIQLYRRIIFGEFYKDEAFEIRHPVLAADQPLSTAQWRLEQLRGLGTTKNDKQLLGDQLPNIVELTTKEATGWNG